MEMEPHEAAYQSHIGDSCIPKDHATPYTVSAFTTNVSGTVYGPELRAGKRFTRKPNKLCSPFKYGVMTRPPPSVDATLSLFARLCADDSMYRRLGHAQSSALPFTACL